MPKFEHQDTPHFSRGGTTHAATGTVLLLLDLLAPAIVGVLGFFALSFVIARSTLPIHPVIWISALAVVVVFVFWNRGIHAARMLRRSNDISSLPFAPDERYRVHIICWPDELGTLQAIESSPFEPERFRAFLPDAAFLDITSPSQRLWSLLPLPLASMHLLAHVPFWVLVALACTVAAIVGFLWRLPTYARLSPNRLEIIRFPWNGTKPRDTQVFTLDGPVSISTKGFGSIAWTDSDDKKRSLPLLFVMNRQDVVRAAIAAALTNHETPTPDSL